MLQKNSCGAVLWVSKNSKHLFLFLKYYSMARSKDVDGLIYKKHEPGVVIKENSLKYWCDNLNEFKGWELYVPDYYIKKIKEQTKRMDVNERESINFDSKFLLSVKPFQNFKFI